MASASARRTVLPLVLALLLALDARAHAQLACEEWRQLAPFPQPPPRFNAQLVSAGQKMILFGGETRTPGPGGSTVFLDDTWAFDFTTGWQQVAVGKPGPGPLTEYAMAYDPVRQRVVLFGGRANEETFGFVDDTYEYDPATATWTQRPVSGPASGAAGGAMAYYPPTGEIVFFGGHTAVGGDVDSTWTWNGTQWTQRFPAHHPDARSAHAMTTVLDHVYLVGGSSDVDVGGFRQLFDDTWEWNGTDWTQRFTASAPAVDAHGLVFASSKLILFGGSVEGADSNATFILPSPFTAWTNFSTPGPPVRLRHAMAWDAAANLAVVFGGTHGDTIYGDTWTFGGRAPSLLSEPSSSAETPPCAQNTFQVLAGGTAGGPGPYTYQWQREVNGQGYDLADNAHFSGTHASSFTISPFRPADDGRYRVLVSNACGTTASSFFEVGIEVGGWGGGGGAPPRLVPALAYDSARARMVEYGGQDFTWVPTLQFFTYGDTYERGDGSWELVANSGPSPRAGAAMAYDAARGVTVLFGGASDQNVNVFNETWEWDGATWTKRADGPGARIKHAMVYDTERQRVQLYGGRLAINGNQAADLWEWTGSQWVVRNPIGDPSFPHNGGWPGGREHPALAYDTARHALVLHGGGIFVGPGRQPGETWELIDDHWHFKGVSGGALARGVEVAGYHEAHGKTILFTPPATGFDIGLTWEWDGTFPWKQVHVASTEPPRENAANLVYDAARKELVLYGGSGPTGAYSERNLVFFDDVDPTCGVPSVCGDGILDSDEQCDQLGADACCTASCQFEAPGTDCGFLGYCNVTGGCVSSCGDGALEAGEECDDPGVGCCDATCLFKDELAFCTGPSAEPGACSAAGVCVPSICGNGIVEAGESCDDGATPGIGCCTPTCGSVPSGPCGDVCRGDQCVGVGLGETQCMPGTDAPGGCTAATSTVAYLGGAGGTLATPDGSVTLVVPPGVAGAGSYSIAAGLTASEFGVGTSATRVVVARLGPAGTVFAPPGAQVTFRWPDADNDGLVDGLGLDERSLTIFHDGAAIGALCATDPRCNTATNTWSIAVMSFSEFALVAEPCRTEIPVATLKLAKLLPPGGDDTLAFQATFPLAAAAPVDPITTGLRVVVQDDAGATIADLHVPPGAYSKATKTGWKANKKLTSWSYASKAGLKASLKRAKGDIGKVTLAAVHGTFAAASLAHATVFLADRCATLAFTGPGKSCALKSKGKVLACKAAPPR